MRRGTVVLTPFPFTDLIGQKVRPAVIVSRSDRPGSDVLLAFITSDRGAPHNFYTAEWTKQVVGMTAERVTRGRVIDASVARAGERSPLGE